jgi:uncharacterized protein YndB with AHSA1/START domain
VQARRIEEENALLRNHEVAQFRRVTQNRATQWLRNPTRHHQPGEMCMSSIIHSSAVADRIERSVVIQASRERVWQALATAEEFGRWFGVDLKGQVFEAGRRTRGPIQIEGYTHLQFDVTVERVEPPGLLSWRWHPYPVDPKVDYSVEEPTLVTFRLSEVPGGTLLTVVESGFDKVPPERRFEAFRMNTDGWTHQLENIRKHVAAS